MNRVDLIGRLTRDPEVTNGSTQIAKYTLAVDRKFKKEGQPDTDFISIVAFGKSAEFAGKYFKKGMKVAVIGRIQTGSYEKDGKKIYTTDIVAEDQEFCESKSSQNTAPATNEDDFMSMNEDTLKDCPF